MDLGRDLLDELFSALGAHLAASELSISLVVVGGASLASTGLVERTTKDVDVIARADRRGNETILFPASPLPPEFLGLVERVARDYGLPPDWLNTVIDSQWKAGLPPRLAEDIRWVDYSSLSVGFVGRKTLIVLKLFAAVDQGPRSKHWQDLLILEPSGDELKAAVDWVGGQDAGLEFQQFVRDASERLQRDLASRKAKH